MVVGVGMGSAVVWRVWVTVGADDTWSICVDPELLLNVGEENEDVPTILVSRTLVVFRALPVFGRVVTVLEVVG